MIQKSSIFFFFFFKKGTWAAFRHMPGTLCIQRPHHRLGRMRSHLNPVLSLASGNLIQFADMVRQLSGRLPSLFYNGYGCYCGLGGSKQPLDETDWCCQAHDCCYGKMSSLGCNPKMEIYSYTIRKDVVACGGKTLCQRMICECDKAASLCFRSAPFKFRNVFYPNILCKGPTPPC
ncbi:hypothetical protein JRQ81_009924 [Phrynocephalus forsythii]|uniref:Phospholipase A2 n=1 Tax=Phrynocephalus forsythii TaxID=171643 RepID=A0A9Q0XCE3_9SAUR|nr:hypothetical protein JRQ81_009924 [Phrynocephalus forsythii]